MMWMHFHISTFRRLFNADDVGAKNNAMLDDYYSIGYAVTAANGKLVEN
jgi:hypothetical protein